MSGRSSPLSGSGRYGKTVIVVRITGFLGQPHSLPYLNEACVLIEREFRWS